MYKDNIDVLNEFHNIICSHRSVLANLINSFYQIPYPTAKRLLNCLKPFLFSQDGIYAYDLNALLNFKIDHSKTTGKILNDFTHLGIFYPFQDDFTNLKTVIYDEILFLKNIHGIKKFSMILSVKTVEKPEHWTAYFFDIDKKIFFYYNSLANPKHINMNFFEFLSKKDLATEYYQNNKRQQQTNNLCGIYSVRFILLMAKLNLENKNDIIKFFFDNFDYEGNLDSLLEEEQWNYAVISNNNEKHTSLYTNLNYLKRFNINNKNI